MIILGAILVVVGLLSPYKALAVLGAGLIVVDLLL